MLKLSVLCVCAALALAACSDAKETTTNAASSAANTPAQTAAVGGALDAEIDAGLAQVKSQLPMKLGEMMEMTSIERNGKDIVYTYTFLTDAITKAAFKVEDGKKTAAQQLCANPETKKYLDAGYSFNFQYKFKDGSDLMVPFGADGC